MTKKIISVKAMVSTISRARCDRFFKMNLYRVFLIYRYQEALRRTLTDRY